MNVAFDTLEQAKRLRAAGFDERQAEAVTAALVAATGAVDLSNLATKTDIAELKAATKADIAELKAVTKADIAELKAATRADLAELKADLQRWTAGLVFGALAVNAIVVLGAMLGLAKLLGH